MSMTNAQAALIAASNVEKTDEGIYLLASDFLSWLTVQDEVPDKPAKTPRCGHLSKNGFPCTSEPHAADTMHHNDEEGVVWAEHAVVIDKPAKVEVARHFLPSTDAGNTTCGLGLRGADGRWAGLRVSTAVKDVTCDRCKVELGL